MAARPRQAKRKGWPPHLHQNGAGYFYWRDPGTKKDYGLGRDQARAFQEARAANAEVAKRAGHTTLVEKLTAPEGGKTLRVWSAEYETIYIETRKPTPATVKTVKAGIRAALSAPFADKKLRAIQTEEVSEYLKSATKDRSPQMAKLIRKTLLDMFREAERGGLIEGGKNPVSVTRTPTFEVTRSRVTLEQFQAIYKVAQKMAPWVARSLELAVMTAQRREDVANLKFSDARDGFLHVVQSKTGKKIRIPLVLRLDALGLTLEDVVKSCRDSVVSGAMLHHRVHSGRAKPGNKINAEGLTRMFAEARDLAELTWEDGKTPPSFHELRSLAARLYSEQYSPEFAQVLLGHSDAAMTSLYRDVRGAEWIEVKVAS